MTCGVGRNEFDAMRSRTQEFWQRAALAAVHYQLFVTKCVFLDIHLEDTSICGVWHDASYCANVPNVDIIVNKLIRILVPLQSMIQSQ